MGLGSGVRGRGRARVRVVLGIPPKGIVVMT